MPIRPENRWRYPKDWREISRRIREERSGGRCECGGECGIDHTAELAMLQAPGFFQPFAAAPDRCQAEDGEPHPISGSRVVLTVAHLDHAPENCDPLNLKAMCQRCHNRLDAASRRQGMAARARARRALGDLFEGDIPETSNS